MEFVTTVIVLVQNCVYGFFLQTNSNIISLRHNLDDGGDGGSEERTPQMVRKKPV